MTMPMQESDVLACPMCESADIHARSAKLAQRRPNTHDWYCEHCREHFDDAIRRERRNNGGGPKGLAGALHREDTIEDALEEYADD
jgi:uncharacterized protein YbaR (Trm112 family)